jgi:hypothetical protein
MDVLFGTYRCPGHEPERFGVEGQPQRGYVGLLVQPFRRQPLSPAEAPAGSEAPAQGVLSASP